MDLSRDTGLPSSSSSDSSSSSSEGESADEAELCKRRLVIYLYTCNVVGGCGMWVWSPPSEEWREVAVPNAPTND